MSNPATAKLRSLCVFCGSSSGSHPEYATAAGAMGTLLAECGVRIIYGGGNVGLMGILADAALAAGGEVIGVIPQMLVDKELAHRHLTDLRIVTSMHERKAHMAELAAGFIALPGGLGTFEELFEVLTWAQLHIHHKPCGCLNVHGYFDPLIRLLDQTVAEGFLRAQQRRLLIVAREPRELLELFLEQRPVQEPKWLGRGVI